MKDRINGVNLFLGITLFRPCRHGCCIQFACFRIFFFVESFVGIHNGLVIKQLVGDLFLFLFYFGKFGQYFRISRFVSQGGFIKSNSFGKGLFRVGSIAVEKGSPEIGFSFHISGKVFQFLVDQG